jgi:F0F1-type ATP synthase assembly protein I
MIKSLFDSIENQPEEIKTETDKKSAPDAALDENFASHFSGIESSASETNEPETVSENSNSATDAPDTPEKLPPVSESATVEPLTERVSEKLDFQESNLYKREIFADETVDETINIERLSKTSNQIETTNQPSNFELNVETEMANPAFFDKRPTEAADSDLPVDNPHDEVNFALVAELADEKANFEPAAESNAETAKTENNDLLFMPPPEPESFAETARKSGLAYAAAITLFASVVFMLIVGWFADLLLGSSPWGIVAGILLGAAIGFIQFFRMTSQIFKNKD